MGVLLCRIRKLQTKPEQPVAAQFSQRIFTLLKTLPKRDLTIYVLIDAIDESNEFRREEIMKQLCDVCDSGENSLILKTLVASRPIPRIESTFNKCITIKLEGETEEDIMSFIQKGTGRICGILGAGLEQVRIIGRMLVERSRGVFLWVKLVLDELEEMAHDNCTPAGMGKKLKTLPEDLDNLYTHICTKLKNCYACGDGMTETLRMLRWVAYSSRPLRLLEFTEAMAVTACGPHDISVDLLKKHRAPTFDQARRMLSTKCGGLLEVKNDIVQFIHQSIREFLFKQPETPCSI
jgi:hypothetical protein